MIEVFASTAVFASIIVLYVLFGARRKGRRAMDRAGANAVLFADRRRELIAEGRVQTLDDSILAELEEELALDLIEADRADAEFAARSRTGASRVPGPGTSEVESSDAAPQDTEGTRPPMRVVALVAVLLAAVAVGLYAIWGEPHADDLALAGQALASDGVEVDALVRAEKALAARVARNPEDANTWFFLGHSRMRLSDYAAAARAFARLRDLAGPNEEVDAAWAQASYLAEGGMNADTRQVVQDVLATRPDHPAMLEMLAMDAMRRDAYAEASGYLARAIGQPLPESRVALLTQLMGFVQSRLDPERPLVEVAIEVGDVTRRPWLIVFARPVGGGMPLAVVRRKTEASQTVVLDDTVGMGTAARLSGGGPVEVVARLSRSGNAVAGDDDLEVSTQPVDPQSQPRVELTFPGEVVAENTAMTIDVSLDAVFDVAPVATVFVIARHAERPGPPLAVKRLTAGDLPARIELTDADSMLPGRRLEGVGKLELVARVALGGSATAVSGDLESATWVGNPTAEPVPLHIDRRLQ